MTVYITVCMCTCRSHSQPNIITNSIVDPAHSRMYARTRVRIHVSAAYNTTAHSPRALKALGSPFASGQEACRLYKCRQSWPHDLFLHMAQRASCGEATVHYILVWKIENTFQKNAESKLSRSGPPQMDDHNCPNINRPFSESPSLNASALL